MKLPQLSRSPRHTKEKVDDSLVITINSNRNVGSLLFMTLWLLFWAYMLIMFLTIWSVMLMGARETAGSGLDGSIFIFLFCILSLFLLFLLSLGTYGIYAYLREMAGKEIISINRSQLTITQQLFGWKREREFSKENLERLVVRNTTHRFFSSPFDKQYKFAFEISHDGKTYRFGYYVKEDEAKEILSEIQAFLSSASKLNTTPMEELSDLSEANWIEEQLEKHPTDPRKDGFRVWHMMPKGFQAYCKIMPPLYDDLDIPNERRTWRDIKRNSKEYKHLSDRVVFPEFNFKAKRILWKELASLRGIEFTPQTSEKELWKYAWPIKYVASVSEGELAPEIAIQLSLLLSTNIKDNEYFFSYVDGRDWHNPYTHLYKENFSSPLRTIKMQDMFPGSAAYWWGIDRDWCLCIDYDLDFAFFGGNKELVKRLVNDDILECIEIEINARYNTYWSMP